VIIIADGDHGASYQDVRDINKLDSSDVPDTVLEKHLDRALNMVKRLLKTDFSSSQPTFTETLFNSRDLVNGIFGSILYFSEFEDYNYINSITKVEYKSSTNGTWETLTEGMESDYVVDKRTGSIKFNFYLVGDGIDNLRVTGTYGYTIENMPEWIKQWIALLSALQGVVYASGGSFTDVQTHSIGNVSISRGQYSVNLKQQYELIKRLLDQHMLAHGVREERTQVALS